MLKPQHDIDRVSLYSQVLGPQAADLAPVLSRLHSSGERRIKGALQVRVATRPIARLLLRLAGIPRAGQKAVCMVRILPYENGEIWQRSFDGRKLVSRQHRKDGAWIIERIGWLIIHLQLRVRNHALYFRSSKTQLWALRLPAALGVQVVARERAISPNTFHCDVRVRSPLLGPLLSYSGTLRFEP